MTPRVCLLLAALVLSSCAVGPFVDEYRFADVSATSATAVSSDQIRALRAGFVAVCRKHDLKQYLPESETYGWLHYSRDLDKWKEDFDSRYLVVRFLIEGHQITIEVCTFKPDAEDHAVLRQELETMMASITGEQNIRHSRWRRSHTFN